MAQRTTQFQAIQEELLEKAAKSSGLEREVSDDLTPRIPESKVFSKAI